MDENADVLVVGAGISGLAFASTYLGVHPGADLLIVEREEVIGGTWNHRRLYDHFYTQWSFGFGEFADRPMTVPPKEDQFWGLFKAKHTTDYLEEYAEKQTFAGLSLKDRIRFSSSLVNAEKHGDGWQVEVEDVKTSQRRTIYARRFVVASGLTSIPSIPHLNGQETFAGRIIHNIDFGSSGVLADPNVKHVTVLGGGKSGADMLYASVKAGKEAAWIVRPSGTGPCTFVEANGKAGFNNAFELASTRAVEALQPSYFAGKNWWHYFLHRTQIGLWLSNKLWAGAHAQAVASADYANRPARGDYSKLVPHSPLFWRNNAAGIVNHEDFYEVIAGSVDSYYDELRELRGNEIHLESGRTIHTDVLLLGTGWKDSLSYLSPSLRASLGLPYPLSAEVDFTPSQFALSKEYTQLEQIADTSITTHFPILASPPPHTLTPITHSPHRLYNLTLPLSDPTHSFATIGLLGTTNYFRTGEAQARYITAYFHNQLTLPSPQKQKEEVALFVAWCRRRYLSSGIKGNNIGFDTLRFTDRIYEELGLKGHWEGRGWWGWFFEPMRARDYGVLGEEFRRKFGEI